jgi:tetratricopeptide (TPR) repeat protein
MKMITAWRIVGVALAFVAMVGGAGMAIAEPTDAMGWRQLGSQQAERGELDAAIASHQKALKLYEAAGNDESMAAEYLALGFVYDRRGDFARAEEMNVKAEKLAEKSGDKEVMSFVYGSLGVFYKLKGDMAKACPPLAQGARAFRRTRPAAGGGATRCRDGAIQMPG